MAGSAIAEPASTPSFRHRPCDPPSVQFTEGFVEALRERRQAPTDMPPTLAAKVQSWFHEHGQPAGALAVILFGSRVKGVERLDSDWDLAVVHADDSELSLAEAPSEHEGNPIFWLQRPVSHLREALRYGATIDRAVVTQGIRPCGSVSITIEEPLLDARGAYKLEEVLTS